MVAKTLELKEGAHEPYSVIVPTDGYAVVNWTITAGSALLNSDFIAAPLSGTNVIVRPSTPLKIDFNILDDHIAETREFFNFHIDIEYFDTDGQSTNFVDDDYTIVIVDNDAACFIDLNGDGVEHPVELTFDQVYKNLNDSVGRLEDTGAQIKIAREKLDAQVDVLSALSDVAKVNALDATVGLL
jgi:hypothetical protein